MGATSEICVTKLFMGHGSVTLAAVNNRPTGLLCTREAALSWVLMLRPGLTPRLYSYACSYKARVEARVKGDAEYIPNKLQFIHSSLWAMLR